MAGRRVGVEAMGVFSRQSPLFIDREDDTMIVPVLREWKSEAESWIPCRASTPGSRSMTSRDSGSSRRGRFALTRHGFSQGARMTR